MNEAIGGLVSLARIDRRIGLLEKKLAAAPGKEQALAQERGETEARIEAEREQLEGIKLKLKKKESELASAEQKRDQVTAKLNQVKTNKEYDAALKEIEEQKKVIGAIESEIIGLMDEVEQSNEKRAALEAEWKSLLSELSDRESDFKKAVDAAQKELADREREREQALSIIDQPVLSRYDTVRAKVDGPVARAESEVCTGCHQHIPPQQYNEVLKGLTLVSCPNCLRLLVPPECRLDFEDEDDDGNG